MKPLAKKVDFEPEPLPIYAPGEEPQQHHQPQLLLQPEPKQHRMPTGALQLRNRAAAAAANHLAPPPKLEQPEPASGRICYNSLNYFTNNPDATQRRQLACTCGELVHCDEDWHTEICDGTLLCGGCSCCSRCGLAGHAANRRLVSISGYVLCYKCIQHYGEPRASKWRPKVIEHQGKRNARRLRRQKSQVVSGSHNFEAHNNHVTPPKPTSPSPIGAADADSAAEQVVHSSGKSQAPGRVSYLRVYHRQCATNCSLGCQQKRRDRQGILKCRSYRNSRSE